MKLATLLGLPLLFVTLAACAPMAQTGSSEITLSGAQEVPATSTLTGTMLMVAGEFSGLSSPLMEIAGTPGHVHQAPAGENGDVVFPLTVSSTDGMSGTFSLSTELTPEQLAAYNAGEFYLNFHTEMHGGGELRGQLTPGM
jgi:hypothetical protein